MNKKYDVAIIGAGPAGIFAAIELLKLKKNIKIALFEEGNSILSRKCPIVTKKTDRDCVGCKSCSIMRGFGGAGAFSDGKYNFATSFGGWLTDYLEDKEIMSLIDYVDKINVEFGATKDIISPSEEVLNEIASKAIGFDLHFLPAKVKHLGTECNFEIIKKQYEFLNKKVDLFCDTKVIDIIPSDNEYKITTKDKEYSAKYLIAAPGRAGAEWFSDQCKKLKLDLTNNQVDIGVRVEVPAVVFKHLTDKVYESKLVYRTESHGDLVRTFCMNPYGHVTSENVDGIVTVNGHSYADKSLRSDNTNFALLVSNSFTYPFKEPYLYGKRIASLSNLLGGGVIVQRFGDLIKGKRSDDKRIAKSFVRPTLNATPGDLSLVLPKRHLDNIIEMIYALDNIAPGTANHDTLLYGVEVKFYSSRLELSKTLETKLPNMYAIGDGAGITRGLAQAAASGIHVARDIVEKENK